MNHLVDEELRRLNRRKDSLMDLVRSMELDFQAKIRKIEEASEKIDEMYVRVESALSTFKYRTERSAKAELKRAQIRIKELEESVLLGNKADAISSEENVAIAKARTIAIFDAILFNICNWSVTGDTAPDFELASQAILFPAVYERVMDGKPEAYLLDNVPQCAMDVINEGREWVRLLREVSKLSLTNQSTWDEHINSLSRWWLDEALPSLYGSRDPNWEHDEPFAYQEMVTWRDCPAARPMAFPKIFDAVVAVSRYSDQMTEEVGISTLNQNALLTRLEPV
jgi:hypothetical protein